MSTIRKVLVPTDFSPHAQEAFCVGHDLAKAIGAGAACWGATSGGSSAGVAGPTAMFDRVST